MKKIILSFQVIILFLSIENARAQCNFTLNSTAGANGMVTISITGLINPSSYAGFEYDFGDGYFFVPPFKSNPVTHTYNSNGTYSVEVTVFDTSSSSTSCTIPVTVSNAIDSGSCSVGIGIVDQTGNTYEFVASYDLGTYLNCFWTLPDGSNTSYADPYYIFNQDSTYNICVDVTSGSCAVSVCQLFDIVVSSAPICNAYFTMSDDIFNTGVYIGYNQSTGNNLSYHWDFGDGTIDTSAYPWHYYSTPGNYLVCLTIDDGAGCSDQYCDSSFYVMKTEGGPMTELHILQWPLSVSTISTSESLKLYPNPAQSSITIESADGKTINQVTVTDVLGKEIQKLNIKNQKGNTTININALSAGVYFIKVQLQDGSVTVRKFIKE